MHGPLLIFLATFWVSVYVVESGPTLLGLGHFEPSITLQAQVLTKHEGAIPLDVRVVRARGDRGYNAARVSVITHAPLQGEQIEVSTPNSNH